MQIIPTLPPPPPPPSLSLPPSLPPSFLTVCSREVRVMNRRKSSQPEDTETVDVFTFVSASVARLISSRRPAIVPAGRLQCR